MLTFLKRKNIAAFLIAFVKILFVLITFIILSLLFLPITIFFKKNVSGKICARIWHHTFSRVLFLQITYINTNCIDENKNYVYVANHQSYCDSILLGFIFPKNTFIIAKNTLKYIPFFGLLYKLSGNFYINRSSLKAAERTLSHIARYLKTNKCSIFLFPQGSRSKDNSIRSIKRGFIKLAKTAEVDIIPIVISSYTLKDILTQFRRKKNVPRLARKDEIGRGEKAGCTWSRYLSGS
ncbi:MAG: lysophospholipid acyltransferase family protein, partial [Bdellovibrionota bacterium]